MSQAAAQMVACFSRSHRRAATWRAHLDVHSSPRAQAHGKPSNALRELVQPKAGLSDAIMWLPMQGTQHGCMPKAPKRASSVQEGATGSGGRGVGPPDRCERESSHLPMCAQHHRARQGILRGHCRSSEALLQALRGPLGAGVGMPGFTGGRAQRSARLRQ